MSFNNHQKSKTIFDPSLNSYVVCIILQLIILCIQELLSTRMNNLYVEGFDDYVITEMINMLCSE